MPLLFLEGAGASGHWSYLWRDITGFNEEYGAALKPVSLMTYASFQQILPGHMLIAYEVNRITTVGNTSCFLFFFVWPANLPLSVSHASRPGSRPPLTDWKSHRNHTCTHTNTAVRMRLFGQTRWPRIAICCGRKTAILPSEVCRWFAFDALQVKFSLRRCHQSAACFPFHCRGSHLKVKQIKCAGCCWKIGGGK